MSLVVASIVEVSMNKVALSIGVRVDDWTAEWAIIASIARQYPLPVYYLKRDLPIKPFPPHSHRQVITVEENLVWFLFDEGAVDTDVV